MKRTLLLLALPMALAACATPKDQPTVTYGQPEPVYASPSPKPVTGTTLTRQEYPSLKPPSAEESLMGNDTTLAPKKSNIRETGTELASAAASPLKDLNIIRPEAPKTLTEMHYVYQMHNRPTCAQLAQEIYLLNQALELPDADQIALARQRKESKEQVAKETTLDAVSDTASSIIPFSGLVRTATGARAAQKRYDEKFIQGRMRRAYLKGYALGIGCPAGISPLTLEAPAPSESTNN